MHVLSRWTWKNLHLADPLVEALGLQFELDLFSSVIRQEPENVEILLEVGRLYTRLGYLQESLAIDERLVRIRPEEPDFHFGLACSLARLDEITPAFHALRTAIELGFRDLDRLQSNPDLEPLRAESRFTDLLRTIVQVHLQRRERDEDRVPEPDFQD